MEKRLTELEHKSGAAQGMRLVFCPATVSDADYPTWQREHAAPIAGDARWIFIVRFVEPKHQAAVLHMREPSGRRVCLTGIYRRVHP